ncbi:hypothetical protein FRC03_008862 [Tulasnella sp. 419]|nr:hypothetical protein FRC03_008862 [Tulasnella sp. 419]
MLYPGCFSIREERVRGEEVISRKSRFIPPHRWFDSQPDSVVEAFGRSYWDKLREASKQTVGEMWEYAEEGDMDDMEGVDIVEVQGAEQDRREPIVAVRGGEDADEAETGLFMRELNEIMEVVDLTTLGRPLLG